jgi:hypothetical protein
MVLHNCIVQEEVDCVLNDFHVGACGNHIYGLFTSQNVLFIGYLYPTVFKYCIAMV